MEILCDVVTMTAPKGVVEPAAFERRISPPPLARVKSPGPCRKFEKVIAWFAAEVSIEGGSVPERLTTPAKETGWEATIVPEKATGPVPF